MTDVPNVTRQEVTVRARHRFFLEGPFHGQKAASKLLNDPFYATLRWQIKQLAGSDPKHTSGHCEPKHPGRSSCWHRQHGGDWPHQNNASKFQVGSWPMSVFAERLN
jgi:hypothetical protein